MGLGIMAGGGSERHFAVRTKIQVYIYLYTKVNSLVQTNLSVYMIDTGIRLKIRLCTM